MDASGNPQIIEHITHSVNYTPFEIRWIPSSARLCVLGSLPKGTGAIQIYEMNRGTLKLTTEVEKKEGIKCATFGASDFERRHLATGDMKGSLNVWDLDRLDKPTFSVQAHSTLINQIDGVGGLNVGYGAPEIATCSRDGCVKVWDPRTNDPVASLEPAANQSVRDCWSVAFGNSFDDSERVVAAGYDNGDIKMFDLRQNKITWETNVKNGVVGLEFDRKDIKMNKLAVTTLESKFRVFDLRTKHPQLGYSSLTQAAHKSTVWLAKHLPQNRDVFMTTGGNGTLNLYKYNYPDQRQIEHEDGYNKGVPGTVELLNSRKISDQPIVSFDWSADNIGLCAMACLDQTIKVAVSTKLQKL